jgi:hypothetical protein
MTDHQSDAEDAPESDHQQLNLTLGRHTVEQAQRLADSKGETMAQYLSRLVLRDVHTEREALLLLLAEEEERAGDA